MDAIEQLKSENARLREALEDVVEHIKWRAKIQGGLGTWEERLPKYESVLSPIPEMFKAGQCWKDDFGREWVLDHRYHKPAQDWWVCLSVDPSMNKGRFPEEHMRAKNWTVVPDKENPWQ